MIAASRVWAFSTLRKLSWIVHFLLVGKWTSRSCIIDSAMSNMAESLCFCRDPAFVPATGAALCLVESEVIYTARFIPCSPWRPDVYRCIGGWALSLRGWPGCVARFGCGSVVRARPRDDGLKRRSCKLCITGSLPSSPLANGQQWVAQERPSCSFVETGKGSNTRVPASGHHTPGCHKRLAGFLRFLLHEEESGECYTSHPDPAPCHHRSGRHRPQAGSQCFSMLPHRTYVGSPVGSAGTVSRSLAITPQSVPMAPADHQTRLSDSGRPPSP